MRDAIGHTGSESAFPTLRVSEARMLKEDEDRTGIYVRAQRPNGSWFSADIYQLDRESLRNWLRSRGGENLFAENVVLLLLGHTTEDMP